MSQVEKNTAHEINPNRARRVWLPKRYRDSKIAVTNDEIPDAGPIGSQLVGKSMSI